MVFYRLTFYQNGNKIDASKGGIKEKMPPYKELRIKAGFSTLEEAAAKLGIGVNTLSRWETGKRNPSLEYVKRLAALYNVTPNELLGVTDEKSPGA